MRPSVPNHPQNVTHACVPIDRDILHSSGMCSTIGPRLGPTVAGLHPLMPCCCAACCCTVILDKEVEKHLTDLVKTAREKKPKEAIGQKDASVKTDVPQKVPAYA